MEGSYKKSRSSPERHRKFHKNLALTNKGLTTRRAEGIMNRLAQEKVDELRQLRMIHNKITRFPSRIFECAELRWLSLCHNQLREIPDSIGQLEKLECLSLFNNDIGFISPEIGKLQRLQILSLGNNKRLPALLARDTVTFEETQLQLRRVVEHFKNVKSCYCFLWCVPRITHLWLPKDVWKLIAKFVVNKK